MVSYGELLINYRFNWIIANSNGQSSFNRVEWVERPRPGKQYWIGAGQRYCLSVDADSLSDIRKSFHTGRSNSMKAKSKFIQSFIGVFVLSLVMTVGLVKTSFAAQFDAPYYEFQKLRGDEWAMEDKAVDEKLAELEKKFGKKPNIIYILTDDIGHGELGVQGGGAARGAPTPNLDSMAHEGLMLNGFYSEPSCTPTRVALMTGRHPARTGLTDVIFPGNPAGLNPEEVTVAEVLSKAGYATAMYGKWHLGEGEETWPHNQGFDDVLFGVYNTAPYAWNTPGDKFFWNDKNSPEFFTRYHLNGVMEARKGEQAHEVAPLNLETLATFEEKTFERSMDFIKSNAKGEKPFFLYWASNFVSMFAVHPD